MEVVLIEAGTALVTEQNRGWARLDVGEARATAEAAGMLTAVTTVCLRLKEVDI